MTTATLPGCDSKIVRKRTRGPVRDPGELLAEFEDGALARISADPALGHNVAGLVGDHLLAVADDIRRRHGISGEVAW